MPSPATLTICLGQFIAECNECHAACMAALEHCTAQGGRYAERRHLRVLADCIEVCGTSVDFMLRHSTSTIWCANTCSQVCHQCAQTCARLEDDPVLKDCAEVCRRYADFCGEIACYADCVV